jgi:hypothetical protein
VTTIETTKFQTLLGELEAVRLEGLVGVFPRGTGSRPMVVHDSPADLDELKAFDVEEFGSPFLGFQALELFRKDLCFRGPQFYPIEQLFLQRQQRDQLNRTRLSFARRLHDLKPWPGAEPEEVIDLWAKDIRTLALTALLSDWPVVGLVGMILPKDEAELLQGSCTLVYCGLPASVPEKVKAIDWTDLNRIGMEAESWVVGLDELAGLSSEWRLAAERRLELRPLISAAGRTADWRPTLLRLAQAADRGPLSASLRLENRLAGMETDDLIAVAPDPEFEDQFLPFSRAKFYYRKLSDGPNLAGGEALGDGDWSGQPDVVTFRALRAGGISLDEILKKLGHATSAARTAHLYSRDLLESPRRMPALSVADLAYHACATAAAANPWAWPEGRYNQFLLAAYSNLSRTLLAVAGKDAAESAAFKMWIAWYAFHPQGEPDPGKRIAEWTACARTALAEAAKSGGAEAGRAWRPAAERLVALGQAFLDMLQGRWALGTGELAACLEASPSPAPDAPEVFQAPSGWFYRQLERLYHAVSSLRRALQSLGADRQIDAARKAAPLIRRQKRLIFALPHEAALLHGLSDALENSLTDFVMRQSRAALEVELGTEKLSALGGARVTFLIRNVGGEPAEQLAATLVEAPSMFQIAGTPRIELSDLPENQETRVTYTIYPRGAGRLKLSLSVEWRGATHDETDPKDFTVEFSQPSERAADMGDNPYTTGIPIDILRREAFFGRVRELGKLLDHLLGSGRHLHLLQGPRRTGKTSLFNMLQAVIGDQPGARKQFDVSDQQSAKLTSRRCFFYSLPAGSLEVDQFFGDIIYHVAQTLGYDEDNCRAWRRRLDELRPLTESVRVKQVLSDLRHAIHPEVRVVAFLDEFDEMERPENFKLQGLLRSVVSEHQWITWVAATARGLRSLTKSYGSPLFNIISTPIMLGDLNRDDTFRLIRKQSQKIALEFWDDTIEEIYRLTLGHPYYVQLLCYHLVEYARGSRTTQVRVDAVETVSQAIVASENENNLDFMWADPTGIEKLILALLAMDEYITRLSASGDAPRIALSAQALESRVSATLGAEPDLPRRFTASSVGEALERLTVIFNILARGPDALYRFSRPLYTAWFLKKMEREDLVADAIQKIRQECQTKGVE